MKFKKIHIHNYRNLDNAELSFDENYNFIVGENNLGKSNLLTLINILFTSRSFKREDFRDPTVHIEINFQLKLSALEIGHFHDLFDISDYSIINITAKQENPDDNIIFSHTETNTYIQSSTVKCLNYIHYDSLRNPVTEINFDKGRGAGKFLRNIISKYLLSNGTSDVDFVDDDKIDELLVSINSKISKIKSFKEFGIKASADSDAVNLLSKIVVLTDANGDNLLKSGYGVQFLILVTLSILEKLQAIRDQRGDRGIFENEQTKEKSISIVIGLDEPEIHLHPYMQRSLVKYLNSIITNTNPDFKELVKDLFDIDEFIGQIIVVTHSPNILLNDYKQLIRFFSDNNETKIISGSNITLNDQLQKHLYLHFPFIKEAFFSRCIIFVEGDSEFSSFPHFGEKLSVEFDDLGICVIQAGGNAVHQLIELATIFGMSSVGVTDKDDGSHAPILPNHFETTQVDFEGELIALIDAGKESVLRTILCEFDSLGVSRTMDAQALNKRAHKKHGIVSAPFSSGLTLSAISMTDLINLKAFYVTWFSVCKSYPLGLLIGKQLTSDDIPNIYKRVILEAKNRVVHV